jgi:hypothetical protein
LKDSCDCRVLDSKILPEWEDLLHFLQKKMMDHEVHGLIHERLIKLVENLPAVDTVPPTSHLFRVFNDSKDYNEFLHGCNHALGAEMLETVKESKKAKRTMKILGVKRHRGV